MPSHLRLAAFVTAVSAGGWMMNAPLNAEQPQESSFGSVVEQVNSLHEVVVLSSADKQALVAVCPALQGRVLTSSAGGANAPGFGWVNMPLIQAGKAQPHFNAYGGEDRLWLGPEGGQYSIFFAPGAPFELDHWYTPAPFDTEPFELVKRSAGALSLQKRFALVNYSGTHFDVQIDREVTLLSAAQMWAELHAKPESHLRLVGYESRNRLTNSGNTPWTEDKGLLSLWILGQFEASPGATIVIPIQHGDEKKLGKKVTSDYFGTVPPERLVVQDDVLFMKGDAGYRAKLGISPLRTKGVLGSYDAGRKMLTIVQFTIHDASAKYVNALWKIQEHPYDGDVVNAYNDGPVGNGKPGLGHFYELETSSPAAALGSGGSMEHVQRTMHLTGDEAELDRVARAVLGVSLEEIDLAFRYGGG